MLNNKTLIYLNNSLKKMWVGVPAHIKLKWIIKKLKMNNKIILKWKWCDIQPSMMTHTRNLCSVFNPSKVHTRTHTHAHTHAHTYAHAHTHAHTHTHTVNTHPEQCIYAAAPGEQLGVRFLAQGHISRGIEGGESAVHLLPPPTIPAGPRLELANIGLWVRFSTIRPQLPLYEKY